MDFAYTIAGLIVGFIVGLTGVGGGSLMTPILMLVFNISPAVAVGTDLLYACITKSGGIFVYHARRTIEWKVVGLLSLGSIPATLISIMALKHLGTSGINYDELITTTLSIALILTSLVLIFKNQLRFADPEKQSASLQLLHRRFHKPATVIAGIIIGVLVSLSSVGAGALGAAFLFFLYPNLRTANIVGTDLAHAVPLTAIAGLGHMHLGTVDFLLLISLLSGSLPGIYLGSHAGLKLPDKVLRPLLASMLLLIGLRMAI